MPINAKLVVVGGEVKTAEIKLRLPSTIGRGRGCTIMLPQALVSRQHCEIFESGGKLMVRDLGSLNGTFVNNQKIAEASPINSEELLTVGTVTFRVVYEGAGAASPPAGPGPVMKSSANETVPGAKGATASPVVVADPGAPPSNADDNSQPLEIGDFDFEDTARPETTPSKEVAASAKTPGGPLGMPVISVGEPAKKPAAQAAAPVVVSAKPAPAPAAAKATAPPAAKPTAAPAAAPVAAPAAPPAAKAPDAEEKAEEEDDFQDFLKSLGK